MYKEDRLVLLCVDNKQSTLDALKVQLDIDFPNLDLESTKSPKKSLNIIKELEKNGQTVAIVISDENMIKAKGGDFLKDIQRKYPSIVRIVLKNESKKKETFNNTNLIKTIQNPWDRITLFKIILDSLLKYKKRLFFQKIKKAV